jgi:hypothetical protein
MSSFLNAALRTSLAFPNRMAALNATHKLARLTRLARDTETLRVTKWLPAQDQNYCTEGPYIFSWPVMISNSVNEFFVAV